MQCNAIPCNTMQYHAIPCNTIQYHASLITTDEAYHCPVGSIRPFLKGEDARDFLKVQIKGPPSPAIDWFCNYVPINLFYVSPPYSAWACFTFPHHSVLQLYCCPDAHHTHEAVKPQAVHKYSNTNTWRQTHRYNVCIHSNTMTWQSIWSKLASWTYSGITLDIKVFSLWCTS